MVLLLGTWLQGSLWVEFGDNHGVTHALEKGSAHNNECNLVIGKIWLRVAAIHADLHAARVETHANIADGPSRDDFTGMQSLGA